MEQKEISIRITGEAGQGLKTIGHALNGIFVKAGLNIFSNMDYMSRIRGGNNYFQIRISAVPVETLREKPDMVIALDKDSVLLHRGAIAEGGLVFLDREKYGIEDNRDPYRDAPMFEIAGEAGGDMYVSSVACGLTAGMTGLDPEVVMDVLSGVFADKSDDARDRNMKAARKGYEIAEKRFSDDIITIGKKRSAGDLLMNGNEAIAFAAIKSGCKFCSAYPMTPATSVMVTLAGKADRFNILVEQAEDEIAAVNMAIGASFAGARSITATSGGGFALMTEGISLAGMTETPLVVVNAQRPAPATGLPTRTEQADLDFVIHGAHGEFAKAVFTPGSIEECFSATMKAFELSDRYQIPAIILTDQHLADSVRNMRFLYEGDIRPLKYCLSREQTARDGEYRRYELTDSGVSPRAVPSRLDWPVYADSDEHTEAGHITESAKVREQMVEKRFYKKTEALKGETLSPVLSGAEDAETVLIGFGSTHGVIKEVCERSGGKIRAIHIPQVWPFPSGAIRDALAGVKESVCVENNAGGQLALLIRRETGIEVGRKVLKFDGRPFDPDILSDMV